VTLDHLRAAYPALGFALYAYDPGGRVTLEVHDGKDVFTFSGATEAEVISVAFPDCCVSPVAASTGGAAAEPETVLDRTRADLTGDTQESGVFD